QGVHLGVLEIDFSADGSLVAAWGTRSGQRRDAGRLCVWDVRSGRQMSRYDLADAPTLRAPACGGLLGWLRPTGASEYRLIDLVTGQTLHVEKSQGADWSESPDGRALVVAGADFVFREVLTGSEIARLPRGHYGLVKVIAFNP